MSAESHFPQPACSTHPSGADSPIYFGRAPPKSFIDPQELERRLRNVTPHPDDYVERWKVEVQRDYEKLIALGGRPTRSIRPHFMWKVTMVDGMFSYRDEDRNVDVIEEVDVTSEEDGLAFSHWSKEAATWREELYRWQKFKEAQQIYHQAGRSEMELELENTHVDLVEVLSKLNDWQDFEFVQQKKVHEAEQLQEYCQQGIAKLDNAMVTARAVESTREMQEPTMGWIWTMREAREQLEASQKELMWVKGQWTEVLAEASQSIAATPKLQKLLEDKVEKQTNAIYRCLQQMGARPSHTVEPPRKNTGFPQRLQHWIVESSGFTAELWNWRIFMAWRRRVKAADTAEQERQC